MVIIVCISIPISLIENISCSKQAIAVLKNVNGDHAYTAIFVSHLFGYII